MLRTSRIAMRGYSTMRNQLSRATSPYLQAHSTNPVAWQQWDDSTLKLAQQVDKPVFLSIGYHTCHWCHVMNKESFMDENIAALLNEHFVPIKVDREERPDIDAVYMMYLQASTGQGGWPLNVFLAPDTLEPFYGGTYWAGPGVTGRNAAFEDVLRAVNRTWEADAAKCRTGASEMAEQLRKLVQAQNQPEAAKFNEGLFDDVNEHYTGRFDPEYGGFSQEPKFAMPHILSSLIRQFPDKQAGQNALFTLKQIGKSGIKDQVGNGFARYSVTRDWNLPHFEKMLYDQALLLHAYTDALAAGEAWAEHYIHDLVQFLTRGSLASGKGAFYSAQDADSLNSEGHHSEGAYYVWTEREFEQAIENRADADMAGMFYGVEANGNVDRQYDIQNELTYKNVLFQSSTVEQVAQMFGRSTKETQDAIDRSTQQLREYREREREAPSIDHKIVTAWNGLAIGALARAGRVLGDDKVVDQAVSAAAFVKQHMYDSATQTLRRVDNASTNGMNDDYSYLISGLLDLYHATFDVDYLEWAEQLQHTQIRLFWDASSGGFFSVEEENATELMFRPKQGFDSAEPSSNGVAVGNLYKLASMLDSEAFEKCAKDTLNCYGRDLTAQPFGYVSMLEGVRAHMNGMSQVIVVGQEGGDPRSLGIEFDRPNRVVVRLDQQSTEFFKNKNQVYADLYDKHGSGPIKAFKCENWACTPL